MATIAKCTICNKEYEVCNTCLEQKTFRPWRTVTDTLEHYKIYLAIHGYTITKNKEVAKKELESCDLSGMDNFNPEILVAIKEIMSEQKRVKSTSRRNKILNEEATMNEKNE